MGSKDKSDPKITIGAKTAALLEHRLEYCNTAEKCLEVAVEMDAVGVNSHLALTKANQLAMGLLENPVSTGVCMHFLDISKNHAEPLAEMRAAAIANIIRYHSDWDDAWQVYENTEHNDLRQAILQKLVEDVTDISHCWQLFSRTEGSMRETVVEKYLTLANISFN